MFKDGFSNDEITPRYVNLEISTFVGFCVEGFLKIDRTQRANTRYARNRLFAMDSEDYPAS